MLFQSAHLVLHYQINLVGLIFMKATIDVSTLVVKKDKGFIISLTIPHDFVIHSCKIIHI